MKKLRGYFWKDDEDAEFGMAVVAESVKEAKVMGYNWCASEMGVEPETFITQRCVWLREADITGLPKGLVTSYEEGLRRNLYGFCEEGVCDTCGNESRLTRIEHKDKILVLCSSCEEELEKTKTTPNGRD